MIELYRSENLLVRSVATDDCSRWVITFDNYAIGHGFDRLGFGEAWLKSQGISAIHVMGRREDWYQYPEMAQAMAVVKETVAGAERVMTYGSSMGGYAAIRFADAAGANAVLALSPQFSIDPNREPFDPRWLQDSHRIAWLPEIDGPIQCQATPVVVYDSKSIDAVHVDLIAAEIEITRIALPYTAHPATSYLAEIGELAGLVFDTLDGVVDAAAVRARAWQKRRNSVIYLGELADRQVSRRPGSALRLARYNAERAPGNAYALSILAKHLSQAGEHDAALEAYERLLDNHQRLGTYLIDYGIALMAAGKVTEAIPVAREIIAVLPHQAHLHAWAGFVFWSAGDHDEAVKAVGAATALDPANGAYRDMLAKYANPSQGRRSLKLKDVWTRLRSKVRRWRDHGGVAA